MKKKLAIVKLVGVEAATVGTAPLNAEFRKSKGIPSDAKELRRYKDVAYGLEAIGIVFEHPSFAEVEDGGLIPTLPIQLPVQPKAPEQPKAHKK